MTKKHSIFINNNVRYAADTCDPLVAASEAGKIRFRAISHGSYPGYQIKNSVLPGLSSLGYWDASTQQDWGLHWHRNEGIELCYLETGKLTFSIGDKTCQLKPEDITVTRPWQSHRLGNPHIGPNRLHWIILDVAIRRPNQKWIWPNWIIMTPKDLRELTIFLQHNDRPIWPSTKAIGDCFGKIRRILDSDEQKNHISIAAILINELLVWFLEMFRMHTTQPDCGISSSQRTVEFFLDEVKKNIEVASYQWTLDDMAKECGLGRTRFRHYCKQLTNMMPVEFLSRCRIDFGAKLMAEKPHMSITDIAFKCGFSSSQYFSNMFRKHKKCSPSRYMNHLAAGRPASNEQPQ